jgi:hypothetical protein
MPEFASKVKSLQRDAQQLEINGFKLTSKGRTSRMRSPRYHAHLLFRDFSTLVHFLFYCRPLSASLNHA